jgi:hypothetical protein
VRYWAYDNTRERLRVWERPHGSYCELWEDAGTFVSVAGPSPAGEAVLPAGIRGTVEGVERTTYRAVLDPAATLHGDLGTADYGCRIQGPDNTRRVCSGDAVRLCATVFDQVRGERFVWDGWLYRSPRRGSWLQLTRGNLGDIYG